MSMTKKLGKALQTGVTSAGITGLHEQTGGRNAGGDVQVFRDKNGTPISVYLVDGHKEYSWTALMETSVADKEKGDPITIDGVTDPCYVTQWDVTESNDDVKRVNIGASTLPGLVVSSGTSNGGTSNPQ